MARTLTSQIQAARMLLSSAQGFFTFVEIPKVGGGYFRLVDSPRHITAGGHTWQGAKLGFDFPEESADGTVGEMRLSVPNVSRLPLAYVEDGELLGQEVSVWIQHESGFGDSMPDALCWKFIAVKATATGASLSIEGDDPAKLRQVPGRRFTREVFPQLLAQGRLKR